MVGRGKEIGLRLRVELYSRLIRLFLRIPDNGMAALGHWAYIVALPFVDDEDELLQLREWEKIFRGGPPLSDAVRRVILDAREEQLKLTLRGILVHHGAAMKLRKHRE